MNRTYGFERNSGFAKDLSFSIYFLTISKSLTDNKANPICLFIGMTRIYFFEHIHFPPVQLLDLSRRSISSFGFSPEKSFVQFSLTTWKIKFHASVACFSNVVAMATYGDCIGDPVVGCLDRKPNCEMASWH